MININELKSRGTCVEVQQMEHLKFEFKNDQHIVSLIDATGYPMLKGYGKTLIEAINDLHHNLL